jgi:FkbM family methyltransferase
MHVPVPSPAGLLKPEYILQPKRMLRRLIGRSASPSGRPYDLPTRWGVSMSLRELDDVGRAIDRFGLFDLTVTEAIWRLIREGDTVVDVGANVGAMTIAAAARLDRSGTIFSFEPHPALFKDLAENVRRSSSRFGGVRFVPKQEALSDANGVAFLSEPDGFSSNRGLALLGGSGKAGHEVATRRLDDYASELGNVALLKIDVEGHEESALRGARSLFESRAIRHVIFEESRAVPSATTMLLAGHGFTIFSLNRTLFRVRLGDPTEAWTSRWEARSLLATLEPEATREAFRAPGWRALSA